MLGGRGKNVRIGTGRLLALALLLGLLALRVADPIPVQNVRFAAFDLFQQAKPRAPEPTPVTVIDIDDASLEEFGQWPWPRSLVAQLIERSFQGGAIAMALDIIFAEPDRLSPPAIALANPDLPAPIREALTGLPGTDQHLADTIAQTRIVLGQTSTRFARSDQHADDQTIPVPHAILGEDARPFLQSFPDLVENLPIFEEAAAGRGIFSVRPDADGIYRRIPLAMLVDGELRLGLGPELLRVATGGQAFALRGNAAGADGVIVGGQLVQTAGDGSVRPYLTPSRADQFVSASDVLAGRVPQGRLQGQLILVGTSAIGLEDFRATALGTSIPGVEIHAQLLENILTDTLLVRPNYAIAVELSLLTGLGLLSIAFIPILGARLVLIFSALLLLSFVYGTWSAFQNHRLLLDPTWPTLGAFLTILLMTSANYLREERERRQVRSAFGQYVSPDLVERLSQHPDALSLGGETRDLTILFSDVRGFTTLAESYRDDPEGLTALMNTFLTALSKAILNERGTIDKFMGDAVMAFWNAPLDTAEHAQAGCRAALAMQAAVGELNQQRAQEAAKNGETALPINVGIGLNSGSCVVGNMGSEDRFDYTALGDPVNLASRLEGQSKTYGMGIVLGQTVAETVQQEFALMELDVLRVKGKREPERVFALLGNIDLLASPQFTALVEANAHMRAAYAQQDWAGAADALGAITDAAEAADIPITDYVAMYAARIEDLRQSPPPEDWGGVFDAQTK